MHDQPAGEGAAFGEFLQLGRDIVDTRIGGQLCAAELQDKTAFDIVSRLNPSRRPTYPPTAATARTGRTTSKKTSSNV